MNIMATNMLVKKGVIKLQLVMSQVLLIEIHLFFLFFLISTVCTLPCLLEWHIALIASGAFVQVLGMLIIVCRILGFCWRKCKGKFLAS